MHALIWGLVTTNCGKVLAILFDKRMTTFEIRFC